MRDSCDTGAPFSVPTSGLRRRPYLQQMTARSVRVVWTTDAATAADGDNSSMVIVSTTAGMVVARVAGQRDPSARPPRAIQWNAALTGLEPETLYCYELQLNGVATRRAGFRTAPALGGDAPVRFVAVGDSGSGSADQSAVTDQMNTVPFDFFIHLGDIGYEAGSRANLEENFFKVYADYLETFPSFPASGNHEYNTEDAAPFREAFMLPENGGAEGRERWYSYDWGNVHLVVLDTERTGPLQAAWLDSDLSANQLPWTFVYFHKPPFSSGEHGNDGAVQRHFQPLFVKHGVPLVLSGHDHDYERTSSISGVTYVVSGGGGRGTRDVGRSSFTAFSLAVCHFVYVTISADVLTGHAIDGVGQEFDSFVVHRGPAPGADR
ncbi:MAG: metallophosphoesterase [Polyangia bacterium]